MVRALLLAVVLAAGCRVSLDDPGTEPKAAEFYFPAGLALDPGNRFLYVTNNNADLRFGGGTVQMVDLDRFACALEAFRDPKGAAPAGCTTAADDAAACQPDLLDPTLVNCDEPRFILADATVKVGNFAGNLVVQPRGAETRRLFVAVRGDPSVTFIDVDLSRAPARGTLSCVDDPAQLAADPSPTPPGCAQSHLLQTWHCTGQPGCAESQPETIPIEPFSLALQETKDARRLLVSHLAAGQVSLIDVSEMPVLEHVSPPLFPTDASNRRSAFALAPRDPADLGTLWYLTSGLTPRVVTFRVDEKGTIVPSVDFTLAGAYAAGNDARQIVFDEGGGRAFITQNNPPSVAVLDTRELEGSTTPSLPQNRVTDIIDVCHAPSTMSLVSVLVPGAPGAPPRRQSRLFVACYLANQVVVIDPELPQVLDIIPVGRGPNQVVIDEQRAVAYVANFSEWTIGVIDLRAGSDTQHRMIARIGLPEPPPRL